MCRAKQFIKSVKNDLEVKKTKAHRKKIQEKSEKASLKKSKLAINDIRQDNSQNKQVSHNIIVGSVSKNNEYFNLYIISELHVLLSAYGIKFKKSAKKPELVNLLMNFFLNTTPACMSNPDAFNSTPVFVPDDNISANTDQGQKRTHDEM